MSLISVHLQGGLGNQLFQLGFLEFLSRKTGKTSKIDKTESPRNVHSQENYIRSIFQNWQSMILPGINYSVAHEGELYKMNMPMNIMYFGYFQNYKFMDEIRDTLINKLVFNKNILSKYPDISNKIFIHVRGGDYLEPTKEIHNINLKEYYQKCIDLCKDSEFVIFTNDKNYANHYFNNKYPIIDESEVDCLYLMSQCKGGICANSSFSWWGAYLNPNRPIYMPSKWFINHEYGNYYFNGVTVVNVNV